MSLEIQSLILLGGMTLLLAFGVEIAPAMGIVAGLGLVLGGVAGVRAGKLLTFKRYKQIVAPAFLVHGLAYVAFSVMPGIWGSIAFITMSRAAIGLCSVMNRTMLLLHVPDSLRGRVFTTVDTMLNAVMMVSMGAAAVASTRYSPREIGVVAGFLSASTAVFWIWADARGLLVEPAKDWKEPDREFTEPVTPA